jgi:hypothetical protein
MRTVQVAITIEAPLRQVFETISDHARFLQGPQLT